MSKVDQTNKKSSSKQYGYISGICFLLVFSSAFMLISQVLRTLEEQYCEKSTSFKALKSLTAFDIRADIYAYMASSTTTFHVFSEEVYINGNRICLDTTGEIYIFGEENQ